MYRKVWIIIGLLCIPLQAHADECPTSESARLLLEKTPIGHYTQMTLERVDYGRSYAASRPRYDSVWNQIVEVFRLQFLNEIQSIVYMLIDTDLHAVEYERDLEQISTCLHIDLAMIEAKMEQLRCELNEAYQERSPQAIRIISSVKKFLQQRYRHLVQGALLPDHRDYTWQYWNPFEEYFDGWCCNPHTSQCVPDSSSCTAVLPDGSMGYQFYPTQSACLNNSVCTEATDEPTPPHYEQICPFDSHYFAPSTEGYGCQPEMIMAFIHDTPWPPEDDTEPTPDDDDSDDVAIEREADALVELLEDKSEYLESVESIGETLQRINSAMGESYLTEEELERLANFGNANPDTIEYKHLYNCEETWDGSIEYERESLKFAALPKRSPFSLSVQFRRIWEVFARLRLEIATWRELPVYMKLLNDYATEEEREEALERKSAFGDIDQYSRFNFQNIWNVFSQNQERAEISVLPKFQDAAETIKDAFKPVYDARSQLGETVLENDPSFIDFATSFAYFIRRSCIERPCNTKLENILQILLSEECFPYTYKFSEDPPTKETWWEECKAAVDELKELDE